MKVTIYIQSDCTALVVPEKLNGQTLPPAQEGMRKSAVKSKTADIDDSIVGLDKNAAKNCIQKNGSFVNKPSITMSEHS